MTVLMGVMGFACANGKASDAQLLAHLKNIKKELVTLVEQGASELGQPILDCTQEVFSELYNKAESFQKIYTHEILHPQFACICNNVGLSVEEIQTNFEDISGYEFGMPIVLGKEVEQELFKLFIPIIKEVHKKYSEKDVTGDFEKVLTDDTVRGTFNNMLDIIPILGIFYDPLLKLIDAKIVELEAQVS